MGERYTKITTFPQNLYTRNSPVLVQAGALLKDNKTGNILAQFKFKNISEHAIVAMKIAVSAVDISGVELTGVDGFQYLDILINPNKSFGDDKAIKLPDSHTRNCSLVIKEVIFDNRDIWKNDDLAECLPIPTQSALATVLSDPNLVEQYKRDTTPHSKYKPAQYLDLWLCSCGTANKRHSKKCSHCDIELKTLLEATNLDRLSKNYRAYQNQIKEEEDKKARAVRKTCVIIATSVLCVLLLVVMVNLISNVIIPGRNYRAAVEMMEKGEYDDAIAAFEALDGYKDSKSHIISCEYQKAMLLMEAGDYDKAIVAFKFLDGYKDSEIKITDCNNAIREEKYNEALAAMNAGKTNEAYEAFIALGEYKDSIELADSIYNEYKLLKCKTAKVGDYITFGEYEQDNDTSNGPEEVTWLILEAKDNKLLLISQYVLDCKLYHSKIEDVTWETCALRKWLNDDFYSSVFSNIEKRAIPTVRVSADKNPEYNTSSGADTQDKVFLLSLTEANKYFSSDTARQCEPTEYAIANGVGLFLFYENLTKWWLRTPGKYANCATFIGVDGEASTSGWTVGYKSQVNSYGYEYDNDDVGVRPALWIDLNALD